MNELSIERKHLKVVAVLSAALFFLGVYLYTSEHWTFYRALKGLIPFSFLGVLVVYQGRSVNWVTTAFLILYGTASIFGIWYNTNIFTHVSMLLNTGAFLLLIGALSPKIDFKKINLFFACFCILLVLVNAYLLIIFVEKIRDFALGELHYFLLMLSSMCLIITGILSFLYNHKFSSSTSLIFTFFVCVLIFTEVFTVISSYDMAYENFSEYLSRALLLIGCSLLVHYEMVVKKPDEVLGKGA